MTETVKSKLEKKLGKSSKKTVGKVYVDAKLNSVKMAEFKERNPI